MGRYIVTGGAGFIGNHLVRALLNAGHDICVIDDFSTGRRENLVDLLDKIDLVHGSVCDGDLLQQVFPGASCCLHQAAVPSVPRSVKDPWRSNRVNVEGTINVILAARDAGLKRVVFASSSSVYGNTDVAPVHEDLPLAPVSPYAVSKAACEHYGRVFAKLYGIDIVGLRYFNVFGPRQDPNSQYAAVIPVFIQRMLGGRSPEIEGDGLQSRDFSYIENVVSANLKAAEAPGSIADIYNVACGTSSTVLQLVEFLSEIMGIQVEPTFRPARAGDIRQSLADISKAASAFDYEPVVGIKEGLEYTVRWYQGEHT
jgi:UDP-glucose 4-epimerase